VRIYYLFYIVIQHSNSLQRITDCETVCKRNINIYVKGLFQPIGLIFIYININMYIPRVWVVTVWAIAKGKVRYRIVTCKWHDSKFNDCYTPIKRNL